MAAPSVPTLADDWISHPSCNARRSWAPTFTEARKVRQMPASMSLWNRADLVMEFWNQVTCERVQCQWENKLIVRCHQSRQVAASARPNGQRLVFQDQRRKATTPSASTPMPKK